MHANGDTVVALLEPYIAFTGERSGDNLAARCPFHGGGLERRPSFYIYAGPPSVDRLPGAAFCHTCQRGWTLPGLMRALRLPPQLIDLASVTLKEQQDHKKQLERLLPGREFYNLTFDMPQLPEHILGVFDYCPIDLVRAGFSKDTLRSNDVGFDRERNRITFGLRDHRGAFVGVSGRTVVDEEPRYKIYRSEFYSLVPSYALDKNRLVWGLDKFYEARIQGVAADSPVILCEGFKAAMWVKQAGYEDAVCVLGTHASFEQVTLLQRVTNQIVLFLDNDPPGIVATDSATRAFGAIDVRVANYDTTQPISPDDMPSARVAEAIEGALTPRAWRAKQTCLPTRTTAWKR